MNNNMLENFFRKPESEQEQGPEQIVELGKKTLLREVDLEIEPKRGGGFMLCTIVAMALAMSVGAGKAEAQVLGIGPQSWGGGREIVGQIFQEGISEVGSTLNRAQNANQDSIEHAYVGQLTQLEDAQRQLDNQYSRQKDQLMGQDGTQEDLRSLENSYRTNRIQLMKARADLEREYRKQIRKTGIKRGLTAAIIQGVRRW
jgi:hypothetical protein